MMLLLFSVMLGMALFPTDGCQWEWSPWTPCDPGPCGQPREVQDRIRTMVKAPNLDDQSSGHCDFSLSGDLESQLALIEENSCQPSEPCYDVSYCTRNNSFACDNGNCVSKMLICNSDDDCSDASDERNCPTLPSDCSFKDKPKFPENEKWTLGRNVITGTSKEKVLSDGFYGTCLATNNNSSRMVYNIQDPKFTDFPEDEIVVHKFSILADCVKSPQFTASQCLKFFKIKDKTDFSVFVTRKIIKTHSFKIKEDILLDSKFDQSVSKLPSVMNYKLYTEFVAKYGTHYPTQISMGGEIIFVSMATEEVDSAMTTVLKGLWSGFAHSFSDPDLSELQDHHDKVAVHLLGGHHQMPFRNGEEIPISTLKGQLQDLSYWQRNLSSQPTILESESEFQPLNKLVLSATHLTDARKASVGNSLQNAIKSFMNTFSDVDSLCNCGSEFIPVLSKDSGPNVVSQYGCLCIPTTIEKEETGGGGNAGGIAALVVLFLLLLLAMILLAVYRYQQLRKSHPNLKKNSPLQQLMAVFCYKGVTKPRRRKNVPSNSSNTAENPAPYESVLYVRESPNWFNANDNQEQQVLTADRVDEIEEEDEDEVEDEEEEEEQPLAAEPVPPVPLVPKIKMQDSSVQADLRLPSSDEMTFTESFVDILGVFDIEGVDLTILPDRRVVVSTQDNKVVLVTVGLTDSSSEVTIPPWKKPRGVAYHFRKDSPVMSSLLVADSAYITHWKPSDETSWTIRMRHVGKNKSVVLDKYELLDVGALSDDKIVILAEKHSVREYRVIITNRDGDIINKWELDKKGIYSQIQVAEGSHAIFISDIAHGSIGVYVPEDGRLLTSFKVTNTHDAVTSQSKDVMKTFSREITKRASFRGSFRRKKKDDQPTSPTQETEKTPKKESHGKEENDRETHPFCFCCLSDGDLLIGEESGVHVWTSYGTCIGQLLRTDERVLAVHLHEDLLAILTVTQLRLYSVFGVPLPIQAVTAKSPSRRSSPGESLSPDNRVSWV